MIPPPPPPAPRFKKNPVSKPPQYKPPTYKKPPPTFQKASVNQKPVYKQNTTKKSYYKPSPKDFYKPPKSNNCLLLKKIAQATPNRNKDYSIILSILQLHKFNQLASDIFFSAYTLCNNVPGLMARICNSTPITTGPDTTTSNLRRHMLYAKRP